MCEVSEAKKEVVPNQQESLELKSVIRFAETLIKLTKSNEREGWFSLHGINYKNYISSSAVFPRWKQPYLSLTFRELIGDNEFIGFDDSKRCSPSYEIMEYQRNKSDLLPLMGYSWTTYKNKKLVIKIDYSSYTCWVDVYHSKEESETVKDFLSYLRKKVDSIDYLRGEKLFITSGNRIKFFDFKHTTKDNLILPHKIWGNIEKNLHLYLDNKQIIQDKGIEWKRGILIWGPPGTGKTLLGKYFCSTLDKVTVLWVTPKCVSDSSDVEKLFEMARALAPTIIFIEDLDFFAADRNERGFHPILGELLTQLDGISSNEGVFVVGTTNDQLALDRAISSRPSRFDVRLEIGFPAVEEREKLFKLFLGNKNINWKRLSTATDGFSAAHIKEACTRGTLTTIQDKDVLLEDSIYASVDEIRREEINKPPPTNNLS